MRASDEIGMPMYFDWLIVGATVIGIVTVVAALVIAFEVIP
jgi:hypothetical protein